MREIRAKRILIIVAIVILVSIFIHLGIEKDIWFCDEVYSYTSANAQSFRKPIFQYSNIWVSGKDVIHYLSANDRSLRFREISQYLFNDHVPLYFWLLRIASIVAVGSCSKWVGLSINIVFYIVLFFCLLTIFDRKNIGNTKQSTSYLAVVLSLVCLLHPVVLSEALTIRMYLMFTLAQVFILMFVKEESYTIMSYVKLSISALFGILTHFYFWIWLAFFSVFYLIYLMVRKGSTKRIHKVVCYMIAMLTALGVATALFPNWFTNIFNNTTSKGHLSFQKIFVSGDLVVEISRAIHTIVSYLTTGNNMLIPVSVFVIVALVYIICKNNEPIVWLSVLSGIAYAVFVIHTQPSVEGRYLWSAAIMILIAFLIMLKEDLQFLMQKIYVTDVNTFYATTGIIVMLILVNISLTFQNDYKNIQYLKDRTMEEHQAIKAENDHPWIVFHDSTNWVFLCSMYDFTIPDKVKRVNLNEEGQYDEVIQNASEVIVYTIDNSKSIEDCIKYIEQSCNKRACAYEKISKSYAMSVYKIRLEVR